VPTCPDSQHVWFGMSIARRAGRRSVGLLAVGSVAKGTRHHAAWEVFMRTVRIVVFVVAFGAATLLSVGLASAASNPSGTGLPSQSCQDITAERRHHARPRVFVVGFAVQ
jgi:hypothetical protein